ncbi:membrane lipoprotein lipid attachment site-containing protein [Polyangium sorediatum]|uniref:Membrane lipoprotein lipid attachment site-containing protein n=1 Tax=Polyangium sorediatum TaxID=889274 RepID=A0ABT6NVW8_9BACT|nr:membrane lipoprotein lipid attachment site-containing protein [Polyangium sorediatum]MDI1432479.1 membrane lipoprotein lipid attachment site-containing protein [Polyangium sorediatum]
MKQILVALGLVAFLAGCSDGGNENTGGAGGDGGSGAAGGQGGAGGEGGQGGAGGAGGDDLQALYEAAVTDASTPEADEISDKLTEIRPDNAELVLDANGRVKMVTWTSYAGYDALVGMETTVPVEVWVTAAPKLAEFCKATGLKGAALDLRLEQLLGLPPGNGKTRVVELWVPMNSMFRPSPDMEIDDNVAQLDFPAGTPQTHIDWITNLRMTSYGDPGYPWTQLGYTYDWLPGGASEVGLSEFVISKGTMLAVADVKSQEEYCTP